MRSVGQQQARFRRGVKAAPAIRWSTPGCASVGKQGGLHNRVRMVAASFLIKHLLIDWRIGADWFWYTLVDADLANNAASWQWVAGCGADRAFFPHHLNPVTQGEKIPILMARMRRCGA